MFHFQFIKKLKSNVCMWLFLVSLGHIQNNLPYITDNFQKQDCMVVFWLPRLQVRHCFSPYIEYRPIIFFHNSTYPILLLLTEVWKSSFPLYASLALPIDCGQKIMRCCPMRAWRSRWHSGERWFFRIFSVFRTHTKVANVL